MPVKPVLAMVTESVGPYRAGGKETRRFEIARRLTADFEVHVYTMRQWPGPQQVVRDGVRFHAICPSVPLYSGARRSHVQAIVFGLACIRLLWRRFDVIETDSLPFLHLFVLRLIANLRGSRLVVTWHEIVGSGYLRSYLGIRGLTIYLVERITLRLPDTIIAVSDVTAARISTMVRDRIPVVPAPGGVDPREIAGVAAGSPDVDVVTVGRLVGHKRVDLLLQVLAHAKRSYGRVTCRIIGAGPEMGRLEDQAQRLGLSGDVEFRDDVTDRAELFGLMKSARVFVSTSEREGCGVAALEGLACGLPVIVTSAPANLAQHVVGKAERGTVCDPDLESVTRALLGRLQEPRVDTEVISYWPIEHTWTATAERLAGTLRDGQPSEPVATESHR